MEVTLSLLQEQRAPTSHKGGRGLLVCIGKSLKKRCIFIINPWGRAGETKLVPDKGKAIMWSHKKNEHSLFSTFILWHSQVSRFVSLCFLIVFFYAFSIVWIYFNVPFLFCLWIFFNHLCCVSLFSEIWVFCTSSPPSNKKVYICFHNKKWPSRLF